MRILVVRTELPWPLCHGGRLHAYELCKRLAERHQLLLLAQRPGPVADPPLSFPWAVCDQKAPSSARLEADMPDLALDTCAKGPLPDQSLAHEEAVILSRLERFFGIDAHFVGDVVRFARQWRPDVAIGMGYQTLSCLSRLPEVPTICDLQDDEALHAWRELRCCGWGAKWPAFKAFLAMLLYQRTLLGRVDAATVLSEADRRFCRLHTGHRRIAFIPHGVDCDAYRPMADAEEPDHVIFWGVLDFGPNLRAIEFFADQVWPRVRALRPQLRWTILGPGDPAALRRLRSVPGINFLGRVEDIRPHVARAAVAIVPMVSGAGIKNKIMEAWAMGKAVLCTPTALGSLPGTHGKDVWLARSPKEWANGLDKLLGDGSLRGRLGAGARQTALSACSWDRAASELEKLCGEVIQGRAKDPARRDQRPLDSRSAGCDEMPMPETCTDNAGLAESGRWGVDLSKHADAQSKNELVQVCQS
ncbi:MAG: glycosyltransferase [Phycisphaerae bacterium]|nr:glycosyltransferase [Phycisphaerae bacterium]